MISKIGFSNYKAFIQGELEIKPLTILLGANSVGKSSLIQLLLMLQQTAREAQNGYDKSAFKLNGEYVSLGENINLLRNKDKQNKLGLSFDLEKGYTRQLAQSLPLQFYRFIDKVFLTLIPEFKKKSDSERYAWRTNRDVFIDYLTTAGKKSETIDAPYFYESFFSFLEQPEEVIRTYDFLKNLIPVLQKGNVCTLSFLFQYVEGNHTVSNSFEMHEVSISCEHKNVVSININNDKDGKTGQFKSDFIEGESYYFDRSYMDYITSMFLNSGSKLFHIFSEGTVGLDGFFFERRKVKSSVFLLQFIRIVHIAIQYLEKTFGGINVNYVSPLRAYPKRYYFLDRTHVTSSLDTLNGDSIAELLKEKVSLRNDINKWLLHFNMSIDVESIEEIIHKLKIVQNGLSLDITDVGFGVSQVLPVIVQGFFAKSGSLTLIEQPEVHLHPRMQADLGDLFIDIALPYKDKVRVCEKYLLIETHSEYLLKRIRRRMAMKEIKPSDVAIYIVRENKEQKCSELQKIKINQFGSFEWPEEFYGGELLKDTIDFLKAQTINNI